MGEDAKMAARTAINDEQFVKVVLGLWWLSVTTREALNLFAQNTHEPTEAYEIPNHTEPEPSPEPEQPQPQIYPPTPAAPIDLTDVATTLLMTATYTIRLFDLLLMAYPGLRADMEEVLDEFAQFIDEKARNWTGVGILEPSEIEEET